MRKRQVYGYFFYYGLKDLEKEDNDVINNFIHYFERDINLESFLDCLINNNFMTSYAKSCFLEQYHYSYEGLLKFIGENDCFDIEDSIDILVFLMCIYINVNFKYLDEKLVIFTILNKIINNFNSIIKKDIFIYKNANTYPFNIKDILFRIGENKKLYLLGIKASDRFVLNIEKIPIFLYEYVLCVYDKEEDTAFISSNDKVSMTIQKKENILELLSLMDCLATDDLMKDSIKKLEKELFE